MASKFADVIHSDVWGQAPVETLGGKNYYVSYTDDATRLTVVYLLRRKSDVFPSYQQFDAWVRNTMETTIKVLHSDRGGEYLGKAFAKYLKDAGTEHRLTVHDTPQQNGVAERLNGVLLSKVRALLHDAGLPKSLWGEALSHAVWLKNRSPTKALNGLTPLEALTGVAPNLSELHEFGCRAWVLQSNSKLDGRVDEGRWIGFDAQTMDGHRIYWPKRRTVSVERNVTFAPSNPITLPEVPDLVASGTPEEEDDFSALPDEQDPVNETHQSPPLKTPLPSPKPMTAPPEPRSSRVRRPSRYVRDIAEGRGTATGLDQHPALPTGMRVPEKISEVSDVVGEENDANGNDSPSEDLAMMIAMADAEGIEPRDIREARRRPD
jgi:hypothetical protein